MITTALTAGFYNIFEFYLPKSQYLLASASAVMMILIVFVIINSVRVWLQIMKSDKKEMQQSL